MPYKEHRDKVESCIAAAQADGAKLVLGEIRPDTPETKNGYFVAPTIFTEAENNMKFMQEEIFWPRGGSGEVLR